MPNWSPKSRWTPMRCWSISTRPRHSPRCSKGPSRRRRERRDRQTKSWSRPLVRAARRTKNRKRGNAMDSGLEGVVAAETVLSYSNGAEGILWVRGHTLPELVADFGYEGAVALLWDGFAGNGLDRKTIHAE